MYTMEFPSADNWVTAPLRNGIRIELNALVNEVWEFVGNPANIFSDCCGVNNVESQTNDSGKCMDYTIYYESENSCEYMVARSSMVWYERNQGWASLDEEPHPMGFEQSLLLVTIEEKKKKTVLNWNMYYDMENDDLLQMFISGLNQSLKGEVAQMLIEKFGGRFF